MKAARRAVVISGVGLVTPLGDSPAEIWRAITAGHCIAAAPAEFDVLPYACPVCARIADFDPRRYLPENKSERLMNRDALLAVAAARLALRDAQVNPDDNYPAQGIALFGSTGLAGVPLAEVARLVRGAATEDGSLDLRRFGAVALRQVRPVLSFKILSNMPICFVSMFANIQGPNAVYNPWEGQGAQALAAGISAIERGDVPCALVGGSDVKTHELGFIAPAASRRVPLVAGPAHRMRAGGGCGLPGAGG